MGSYLLHHGGVVLAVLWDVLTAVVVPIAAAGVAAWFVAGQIRQLDRHRNEDRRTQGIIALTQLLESEALVILDPSKWATPQLERFKANESLVRAYALLRREDAAVPEWVASQRDLMHEEVTAAQAAGEFGLDKLGDHRANALRIAAEAMEKLLQWQKNDARTAWFRSQNDSK